MVRVRVRESEFCENIIYTRMKLSNFQKKIMKVVEMFQIKGS